MRFKQLLEEYSDLLSVRDLRKTTICSHLRIIKRFKTYLEGRGIKGFNEVGIKTMIEYLDFLKVSSKYSHGYIYLKISILKSFFRFLYEKKLIDSHLVAKYSYLRPKKELPKDLPEQKELFSLLDRGFNSLEKALLELYYGTGLRLSEAIRLNLKDLDFSNNLIFIKEGKGRKDRIVPVTDTVLACIKVYLKERGKVASGDEPLFLSRINKRITPTVVYRIFKKLKTKKGKRLNPHTLRHCFATHMLENDASIRDISEILGHEDLSTTARYTKIETVSLKRIIKRFHPRENEIYSDEKIILPKDQFFSRKKGCKRKRRNSLKVI